MQSKHMISRCARLPASFLSITAAVVFLAHPLDGFQTVFSVQQPWALGGFQAR